MDIETYDLKINHYTIRNETLEGRNHLVVPAVIMREGVHCGSHGAVFHPAEELGKYTAAWNGIPVIVKHPQDSQGNYISANIPDVVNNQVLGRIFNTRMDGDRLRTEVWIDEDKTRQVSPETLGYINQNRPLDVSVGVFTDDEELPGIWNDEEYSAIARNHRPDHLALLPGEQGACSFADGCGIRANKKGGADLEEKPDPDKTVSAFDAKVFSSHLVENRDEIVSMVKKEGLVVIQANQDPGFQTIARVLQRKLDDMDTDTRLNYLQELFADHFIYEVRQEGNSTLFRRDYTVDENGNVEITGDPVEVVREVTFKLKVNTQGGADNMCTENKKCAGLAAKVDCVIKNNSKFTEDDRDLLSTFSEEQFDRMIAVAAEPEKTKVDIQANDAVAKELQVLKEQLSDPDKAMALLPQDVQDQINYGLGVHKQKVADLVQHISTNSKVYSEDELKGMDIKGLEKIAQLIPVPVDYTAMGGDNSNLNNNANAEEVLLPAGVEEDKGGD